jgi:hypothetical protein
VGFLVTAWVALGCSDPAAPPPQASAYANIKSAQSANTPPGKACSVGAHNLTIGDPPSTTTRGKPIVDEEGGKVSCTVTGGGTFSFKGSATHGSTSFTVTSGTVKKGTTGSAVIQTCDPDGCLVSPTEPDADGFGQKCEIFVDGDKLGVNAGRIWARFNCPTLGNPTSQPNLWCASDGIFVFENCDD